MKKESIVKKKSIAKKESSIKKSIAKKEISMKKEIGKITHFFDKIGVAVIELTDNLKVGDIINVQGATSSFQQLVDSMQVEHKPVKSAKKGQAIGLKVKERVRPNDKVFLGE